MDLEPHRVFSKEEKNGKEISKNKKFIVLNNDCLNGYRKSL